MTPKILFTDIDGTLLNKDRELSEGTLKQIKRINSILSVPVILVSARMPKSMRILQSQLGITSEIICYNGSLILGREDSTVLDDQRIDAEISEGIIREAKTFDLHFSLFVNNNWLISKNDSWADREIRNTKVIPDRFDVFELNGFKQNGFHKIMLMGDSSKIDFIQHWLKANFSFDIIFYRSKDTYLEINPIKKTKLSGIMKILSIYNLEFKDAIAIGDNHNDIEMIKHAGIGVAVENAPDEIKKVADFICPSNINDGVATTIKKFF